MSFVKQIRLTAAQFTAQNPTLDDSTEGFEIDTLKFKKGDGSTTWANLLYADPTAAVAAIAALNAALALKADAAKFLTSYLATTVTYNANAVLANTPLSVTVAAGGIYDISLVVHSTNAVKALAMDFAGTATVANFIGQWSAGITPFSDFMQGARVTAAGTDFNNSVVDGAADVYYTFTGSVEITDAGTFLLRGAQNVSDASDTTILRGSTLTLTKMN